MRQFGLLSGLVLAAGAAASIALAQTEGPPRPGARQPMASGPAQTQALSFAGGRIFQASGFANTFMVTTKEGDVIIDTSSLPYVARHRELLRAVSTAPIRDIILTHAHGDHTGGVAAWKEAGTHVIGQANEVEFRNYQTRLSGFFQKRNAAQYRQTETAGEASAVVGSVPVNLNPGDYASPPLADILFDKSYKFKLGDLDFEAVAAPGETPDHLFVWVPELKAVFIGDNYYASFPNLYTLRGTEPRWALDYVTSINKVLALKPEIVLPSHGTPILGADKVQRTLTQYRDAILYVHDAVVRGMNEGKDVYTLMREVKLPPELEVGEGYGAVAWSVRGIYEGYAGWFDGDPATMYAAAPVAAEVELARLSGAPAVAARAQKLLAENQLALSLRLTRAALSVDPLNPTAQEVRREALTRLLQASKNSNESGWLRSALTQLPPPN